MVLPRTHWRSLNPLVFLDRFDSSGQLHNALGGLLIGPLVGSF